MRIPTWARRSIPHRLCSLIILIQGKTPSALIRSAVANPVPGRKPEANGLLKGREIVRRDYPDHDHPKLLEHCRRPARKHSSNGSS